MVDILSFVFMVIGLLAFYLSWKSKDADGTMVVTTNEEGVKLFSMEISGDLDSLDTKKTVTFKVSSES